MRVPDGLDQAADGAEQQSVISIQALIRNTALRALLLSSVAALPPAAEAAGIRTTTQYGGVRTGQHEAGGFFRVEQADGRWWLIDPDGGRFISTGLNSVSTSDLRKARAAAKLDPVDPLEWARAASSLIRENGFNTLGAWSDFQSFREAGTPMPYTRVLHIASAFGFSLGVAQQGFGNTRFAEDIVPVFHRDFASFCRDRLRELVATTRDDPWLIGYFSDNELPFKKDNILRRCLRLPEEDENHREARTWLEGKYGHFDPQSITEADDSQFCAHVIDTYFRIVAGALRQADLNHLFLGSRFHGKALRNEDLFRMAGRHVDVISVNYYHRWDAELERLAGWERLSGRPLLVTEFYARHLAEDALDGPGAGFRVKSERERGKFYRNFALGLLQSPHCIGWHWHRFSDYADAGPGITQGIVTALGEPHQEVLAFMSKVNAEVMESGESQ